MTAKTTALTLLLLLSVILPARAASDEIAAQFKDLSYPIQLQLPVPDKEGGVLFETSYSEAPETDYDTVLIQGEMPDPGVRIELAVKGRTFLNAPTRYTYDAFRRFPNGRFWARYTLPASRQPLKISVLASGSKAPSSLTIYESELFIAGTQEEILVSGSTVPYVIPDEVFYPAGGPFPIIRRAEWQANPPREPYTQHEPKAITLHHTQGNYPQTLAAGLNEMGFIQDYHQNAKKWIDIGYHFLIDPLGNIYEGRPIKVVGAHVAGRNTNNVGISIMGNYHKPAHNVFTDGSKDSFVAVGRYITGNYTVNVSSFYAHRDIGNSDCPGDDLYARKGELRSLVFAPAPQSGPGVPTVGPVLTPAQESSLRQLRLFLNSR